MFQHHMSLLLQVLIAQVNSPNRYKSTLADDKQSVGRFGAKLAYAMPNSGKINVYVQGNLFRGGGLGGGSVTGGIRINF